MQAISCFLFKTHCVKVVIPHINRYGLVSGYEKKNCYKANISEKMTLGYKINFRVRKFNKAFEYITLLQKVAKK